MRMAKRDRERVRLILTKRPRSRKEPAHHEADLVLGRRALPDNGELHLWRRVLVNVRAALAGRQQYDAPNVADLERGMRALPNEGSLDRDFLRARLLQDLHQTLENREQAVGE